MNEHYIVSVTLRGQNDPSTWIPVAECACGQRFRHSVSLRQAKRLAKRHVRSARRAQRGSLR